MTPHRVLIVDDYPDAADIASTLLAMLGQTCRTATSGRDALVVASAFQPDLVILDIGLPDISGYDVARELRNTLSGPLFIAAVTGWGTSEDRVRAFAAGFDHHVLKPADGAKLREILRLADQRMRPAVTTAG